MQMSVDHSLDCTNEYSVLEFDLVNVLAQTLDW